MPKRIDIFVLKLLKMKNHSQKNMYGYKNQEIRILI